MRSEEKYEKYGSVGNINRLHGGDKCWQDSGKERPLETGRKNTKKRDKKEREMH